MSSRSPVYLASDVHLGAVPPERERAFLDWLEHATGEAVEIVINGDLFDFWFEYRSAIPRGYTRVLGALARAVDAGVLVRLMGGNHDWWGGSFLEEEIGVVFHRDPVIVDLAGHRTFLAHGDGLGEGDLGYRLLRILLRARLARWAFGWVHPDLGDLLAHGVSDTETRGSEPTEDDKRRADALEAWAVEKLESDPDLDLVILGHTHIPLVREVGERRWYVNGGDWVHHHSYVVLRERRPPELRDWIEDDGGSVSAVTAPGGAHRDA